MAQILAEASMALAPSLLEPGAVRASFAGPPSAPFGDASTVNARRETVFSLGRGGMLSVAGGKLTTYRRIALDALERIRGLLGLRQIDRTPLPPPGRPGCATFGVEIDPDIEAHLRHLYGSRAAWSSSAQPRIRRFWSACTPT